ncbi:hypothetical protein LCGC14_0755490 [marine sediment metagenome]|uniref:HNH endonuclease n=1 Tax=marine sediment metagenome TaxID=412755 RepID=A0A0F9SMY9_9ZZZZ
MFNIIKKCQDLELELSKYKLCASLIPKKSFFANLRKVLIKKQWDLVRRFVYKKDFYRCFICGKSNVRLEAHENWEYDYKNSIQKLQDINALCKMCHLNIHLGLSMILVQKGKLCKYELREHWCTVNQEELINFKDYQLKVNVLWIFRNQFEWKIVDKNDKNIFKGLNFNELIRSLV